MSRSPMNSLPLQLALFFLISTKLSVILCDNDDQSINRVYSDLDESSCICGLNTVILDRLESIVKATTGNTQNCAATAGSSSSDGPNHEPTSDSSSSNQPNGVDGKREPDHNNGRDETATVDKLNDEIHKLQDQLSQLSPNSRPIQSSSSASAASAAAAAASSSSSSSAASLSLLQQQSSDGANQSSVHSGYPGESNGNNNNSNNNNDGHNFRDPVNSGFLGGLSVGSSSSSQSGSSSNSGQGQNVDNSVIQNALEQTIPSVVSNIFSNIQNLTIQAGQHTNNGANNDEGGQQSLTSIDGSSINISGSSVDQITAQGEQLFLQWIDHQLQGLHLTVSMAESIRRNALSLFRRIVRQYVERVKRTGGKVEDNVRRATQVALNNTQNLIAYLLKNYLNFASGLMRIIGEQVSRVGRQLDSTGDTIANINLNPFDIVSNVIESLPNPTRYSEYFRAVGKYLMGDSSEQQQAASSDTTHSNGPSDNNNTTNNNNSNSNQQQDRPRGGLFSKTMGALGKTLGSWIG